MKQPAPLIDKVSGAVILGGLMAIAVAIGFGVIPNIETAIGITNVSHYPDWIIYLGAAIGGMAGGVLGWLWADR